MPRALIRIVGDRGEESCRVLLDKEVLASAQVELDDGRRLIIETNPPNFLVGDATPIARFA
jgi:hypothetical protein